MAATVEEDIKSRTGLQLGVNGAYQATRTFRVFLDTAGQNPIGIMQRSTTTGGLSIGEGYPWTEVQLNLIFFAIRDCLTPKLYIVDAVYGPPFLAFPSVAGWAFRTQAGLDTEHRLYDLDGKGIGPAAYSPVENIPTAPYHAQAKNGQVNMYCTEGTTITAQNARKRHIVGADRYIPGGTALFTKTVPQFDTNTIGFANANVGTVNSDDFNVVTTAQLSSVFLGPQGRFMLAGVTAEPEIRAVYGDGIQTPYPSYRVTVEIRYRRDGWNHHLTHTYKTDDGSESPVTTTDGELVTEEFRMYDAISFSGLMESFGG